MVTDHPEWTLTAGDWSCTVSPFGASLRRLWLKSPTKPPRDVLWGYSGTANKRGGQGDVLLPWPGRIRDGTYKFEGQQHTLPKNDKDGPNAIHGFLRTRLWEGQQDSAAAHFRARVARTDHAGYPFELDLAVGYELQSSGLACAFVAHNPGTTPAPLGAGFHPYIATPGGADSASLHMPATRLVEYAGLLPTGRIGPVPPELDFRVPRTIGGTRLNHCFTGLQADADGFTRVRVGDVVVWMDAGFPHIVLYTGDALGPDARHGLAVEPMTCGPDAFNHPGLGATVLQPGETRVGTWGIGLAA